MSDKKPIKDRDWLTWDETENIFGGIWEMETPCGRFFRVNLGGKRGLGFYAIGRIKSHIEADMKKAWEIAEQSRFRKVESIHFGSRPTTSFVSETQGQGVWHPMSTAPKDGTAIRGKYADTDCGIYWSTRPVCMLGPVNGGFPPGWATDGTETDYNLPMDPPEAWRPYDATTPPEVEGGEG